MKIFITGSKGFIGLELIDFLEKKYDYQIIGYDLASGEDILDYEKMRKKMEGANVVVHLAALRKPYEEKIFNDYFQTNCVGTYNVARACVENKIKRLIYTSSTSYYGFEKGIAEFLPVLEDSEILTQRVKVDGLKCRDCDIAYSTSKVIAEQILANFGLTKKFEIIILRFGPTRKRGEYRPFGNLKLHLKIENALQVLDKSIHTKKEMWYEAFNVVDQIKGVDIKKAISRLNYSPI